MVVENHIRMREVGSNIQVLSSQRGEVLAFLRLLRAFVVRNAGYESTAMVATIWIPVAGFARSSLDVCRGSCRLWELHARGCTAATGCCGHSLGGNPRPDRKPSGVQAS